MPSIRVEEMMRLTVKIAQPYKVGRIAEGSLQVIPITGGTVSGAEIHGSVVPGGADWSILRNDGLAQVSAKYVLETNDGEFIVIENEGIFDPNGESVIKTIPRFQANCDGRYRFLNDGVYVGELVPTPNTEGSVDVTIYRVG